MQQYADTVLDANGNDLVGAQVLVQTGGVTAPIYVDNGITPQTNPMTTDSAGRFAFYAADGTYALIVSDLQGHQTTVITTLLDSSSVSTAVNAATNAQASAVAAALSAGQAASVGVPVGGTTNQVLAKASNADRDLKWSSAAGGAFSITGDVTAPSSSGVLAATVKGLNGVTLTSLSTGLLKNTAGVPSTAVAGTDYQAPLVSATNIKTINGNTLLGAGDLTISGGGTGSPGGSDTQVQFNDAGNFAGDATFTFNKITGAVGVSSLVSAGPVTGFNLSGTNTGDETAGTIKSKLGISTLSGANTGDQTISISGDVTASGSTGVLSATVGKINGTALSGLATGLLKNTTTTGVPSIAVAGTDYQAPLVSATNIKTINGSSILGSGDLSVAGGTAGLILLATATPSAVATCDFTSGIDATYDEYEIHVENLLPASAAALWLRMSSNAGSTWDTTLYSYATLSDGNGSPSSTAGAGGAQILLTSSASVATAGSGWSGVIRVFDPASTASSAKNIGALASISNTSNSSTLVVSSGMRATASAVNGLRLMFATGNIASGKVKLYGVRKV